MYVNVSEINDFTNCRFRWWAKVVNRVPKHDSQPLAFGKLIHLIFEDFHKNGATQSAMRQAIQVRRNEWVNMMADAQTHNLDIQDIDVGTKVLQQLDDLTEPLLLWQDRYPVDEDLEVEEPFEYTLCTLPNGEVITARGRPDRVFTRDNYFWHKQHKALNSATHFGVFIELNKRSYHEHLYAEALQLKYPHLLCGGVEFDLIRKLKYRTNITKSNPEGKVKTLDEMFFQCPMTIDLNSPVHKHVMKCLKYHAAQMYHARQEWEEHGLIPAPNEGMNGGMFKNKPDEYFRVLIGEYELDDDRYFKNREDTYASSTETDDE
jgi:hypothetical protein